jgi:hypothetical protein
MKTIKRIPDVIATSLDGTVLPDDKGNSPVLLTQRAFLLNRLADPRFIEGLEGYEAAELLYSTRKRIEEEFAKRDGYVVLEDTQYKHILQAVLRPVVPYNSNVAHCVVLFMREVKNAKDCDQRAEDAANGKLTAELADAQKELS